MACRERRSAPRASLCHCWRELSRQPPREGTMTVRVERDGPVTTVILDRPDVRNAVDGPTAAALAGAFRAFDADDGAHVAVLWGAGGTFCSGADLKAIGGPDGNRTEPDGEGPMGPTRLRLAKPVIDGGTVRLPRLVGLGRALDMILTGRPVAAPEALAMGLADRVVPPGQARPTAEALAHEIAELPQQCLRSDRASALEGGWLGEDEAMAGEFRHGMTVLAAPGMADGVDRFRGGAGRGGAPA